MQNEHSKHNWTVTTDNLSHIPNFKMFPALGQKERIPFWTKNSGTHILCQLTKYHSIRMMFYFFSFVYSVLSIPHSLTHTRTHSYNSRSVYLMLHSFLCFMLDLCLLQKREKGEELCVWFLFFYALFLFHQLFSFICSPCIHIVNGNDRYIFFILYTNSLVYLLFSYRFLLFILFFFRFFFYLYRSESIFLSFFAQTHSHRKRQMEEKKAYDFHFPFYFPIIQPEFVLFNIILKTNPFCISSSSVTPVCVCKRMYYSEAELFFFRISSLSYLFIHSTIKKNCRSGREYKLKLICLAKSYTTRRVECRNVYVCVENR